MRWFLCIALTFCAAQLALSQIYIEKLYLKNGSIIRGIVVEQVIGTSVKIKTTDGSIWAFPWDEVLKIEKEIVEDAERADGDSAPFKVNPAFGSTAKSRSASTSKSAAQNPALRVFGIGAQYSFPAYGVSVMINPVQVIGIQGIFGIFSDFKTTSGRVLLRLSQSGSVRPFIFVDAGSWTYTGAGQQYFTTSEKSIFGVMAGGGAQYFIGFNNKLAVNAEVGYTNMKWQLISNESVSAITYGAGFHFFF